MATEKRLIDANALLEHLTRCIEASKGLMRSVCVAIKCFVEQMPTVDAVEVVHGRWIEKQEPIPWCEDDADVFDVCSVCDCASPGKSNYCPNCGAKMDGDGNG